MQNISTVEMVKRKQLGGYNYHGDSYRNIFGLRWGVYIHIYVYNIDKYEFIHYIYTTTCNSWVNSDSWLFMVIMAKHGSSMGKQRGFWPTIGLQ